MAVKFKRDSEQKFDWNLRGRSPEAVRKKTLYIYLGLAIAFFASLVAHMVGQGVGDGMMSSLEGSAVIVEKIVRNEGVPAPRYFLRCEVEVALRVEEGDPEPDPATKMMSDLVMTDEASFELVDEGSRITVMYRMNRNYSEMRIHRMILNQPTLPLEP